MTDRSPAEHVRDAAATASYVAAMTAELSRLARSRGFDTLAYILEMARQEAAGLADARRDAGGAQADEPVR